MNHSDDLFCTPFCCPERLPTRLHPSPNSELPPEQLERQQRCIQAANEVLRTIGNPRHTDNLPESVNLRALQMHVRQLRGQLVRVIVQGAEREAIVGGLEDAGRDFLTLDLVGEKKFVRYQQMLEAIRWECQAPQREEPELIDIDTCFRRELVLDFGRTVAENPFLINLFFGIALHVQLLRFIGREVAVMTESTAGMPERLGGQLVDVIEDELTMQVGTEVHTVKMDKIVYVTV